MNPRCFGRVPEAGGSVQVSNVKAGAEVHLHGSRGAEMSQGHNVAARTVDGGSESGA